MMLLIEREELLEPHYGELSKEASHDLKWTYRPRRNSRSANFMEQIANGKLNFLTALYKGGYQSNIGVRHWECRYCTNSHTDNKLISTVFRKE